MSPWVRYGSLALLIAATGALAWYGSSDTSDLGASTTPTYVIAGREDVPELGVVGEILVPSVTRSDPDREGLLREIAAREALTVAFFFSTEEAIDAHRAAARDAASRAALRTGFLGRVTRGEFTPGEEIYP